MKTQEWMGKRALRHVTSNAATIGRYTEPFLLSLFRHFAPKDSMRLIKKYLALKIFQIFYVDLEYSYIFQSQEDKSYRVSCKHDTYVFVQRFYLRYFIIFFFLM